MSDDPRELLIEQAASAFRERDVDGRILASPAWWDLSAEDRDAVYVRQFESRVIERALHPSGSSSTVHAVIKRMRA